MAAGVHLCSASHAFVVALSSGTSAVMHRQLQLLAAAVQHVPCPDRPQCRVQLLPCMRQAL